MPRFGLKLTNYDLLIKGIYPPAQETMPACCNACLDKPSGEGKPFRVKAWLWPWGSIFEQASIGFDP
jgi:hypothetical protein